MIMKKGYDKHPVATTVITTIAIIIWFLKTDAWWYLLKFILG